jgi:flagellar protein FlaG
MGDMQNKVAPYAAASDPTFNRPGPAAASGAAGPASGGAASEEVDLRLEIEEDQASGTYVYKTIDRRTGEVVQQFPREEILRLRQASAYQAGEVIRTKA